MKQLPELENTLAKLNLPQLGGIDVLVCLQTDLLCQIYLQYLLIHPVLQSVASMPQ